MCNLRRRCWNVKPIQTVFIVKHLAGYCCVQITYHAHCMSLKYGLKLPLNLYGLKDTFSLMLSLDFQGHFYK